MELRRSPQKQDVPPFDERLHCRVATVARTCQANQTIAISSYEEGHHVCIQDSTQPRCGHIFWTEEGWNNKGSNDYWYTPLDWVDSEQQTTRGYQCHWFPASSSHGRHHDSRRPAARLLCWITLPSIPTMVLPIEQATWCVPSTQTRAPTTNQGQEAKQVHIYSCQKMKPPQDGMAHC